MTMRKTALSALVLALGVPTLAACEQAATTPAAEATGKKGEVTETLSAALAGSDDLSTLNQAIKLAGIGSVFDGPGSYTVLAPSNAAFAALGEQGKTLMSKEQAAMLAGLMREHILPGHLTGENISEAIADKGGPVTMTTLGGGKVIFSKEGDKMFVANEGGAKGELTGAAQSASNGVVLPVSAVLLPPKQA